MIDVVNLKKQVIEPKDLAAKTSIMFDDSRLLRVHGPSGSLNTELLKLDDAGTTVGRVISSGHEIELKDSNTVTILMPIAGRLDIRITDKEYMAHPGRFLVVRPSERLTRATPIIRAKFKATTLQIAVARLQKLADACGLPPEKAFATDAGELTGSAGKYLARQLPQLSEDLFARPGQAVPKKVLTVLATLIDEQICYMLGDIVESSTSKNVVPAFHRVRQAEDLMHARSDEPLSMLDVAQSLGVSLRSLQLAFNEVYDLGPRDILNRIRLDKARQRLLAADADGQVTTVALDCGFFHLSRFAQAYARAYGERPSETLARRRA